MNKILKIIALASIALLYSCSKEIEDNPEMPDGYPFPGLIYFFCGEDAVTEAHNSTLTIPSDTERLTLDLLSYGLESITKTGGSEYINAEVQKFAIPPDIKYYYNTVDNPYYKFYRYRQPVTFLFSDDGDSIEPLTATFRINSIGYNGCYADITIIKEKNNQL